MSGLAGDIEEALLDNDNYHTFEVLQDIEMGGDTEETCLQYNGNYHTFESVSKKKRKCQSPQERCMIRSQ